MELAAADRIGQGRHLAHSLNGVGQFAVVQFQAGHQGWGQAGAGGGLQVGLVGGHDRGGVGFKGIGHGQHRRLPLPI